MPAGQASAANWTLVQTVRMWAWSRKADLGRVTWALAMLASPGLAVRVAIRAGFVARLVAPLRRRLSLGLKPRAAQAADLEGAGERCALARERGGGAEDRHRVAGGRVEGELVAAHVERDAPHVERDAGEDRRDRVADGVDLGGGRVNVEGCPDDDGAEVEGTRHGRGDDRQAEGRALIGTRQVGVALDVEGRTAGSGADVDGADFGLPAGSSGWPSRRCRRAAAAATSWASEQ